MTLRKSPTLGFADRPITIAAYPQHMIRGIGLRTIFFSILAVSSAQISIEQDPYGERATPA